MVVVVVAVVAVRGEVRNLVDGGGMMMIQSSRLKVCVSVCMCVCV